MPENLQNYYTSEEVETRLATKINASDPIILTDLSVGGDLIFTSNTGINISGQSGNEIHLIRSLLSDQYISSSLFLGFSDLLKGLVLNYKGEPQYYNGSSQKPIIYTNGSYFNEYGHGWYFYLDHVIPGADGEKLLVQYGLVSGSSSGTVTLLKPYSTVKYWIGITPATGTGGVYGCTYGDITTTGFNYWGNDNPVNGFRYLTVGFSR